MPIKNWNGKIIGVDRIKNPAIFTAMTTIEATLMKRDGCTREEAREALREARERVLEGENPEDILYEDFGLEPDYIWELI